MWVDDRKVENEQALRMRYCERLGGWVGGTYQEFFTSIACRSSPTHAAVGCENPPIHTCHMIVYVDGKGGG